MDKFTNEDYKTYDKVCFYDTSGKSIEQSKDLQDIINALYTKSDKQTQSDIKQRLSNNLVLEVNKVTTNELNPFIKEEVKLIPPRSIMAFESFMLLESKRWVNFKQSYTQYIKGKIFDKYGEMPNHMSFMLMNQNVYKKIYNTLSKLYKDNPPPFEVKRFPFFRRNLKFKDFTFIRLMEHYSDQLFSDEMWIEYERILSNTDKIGKKGEEVFKSYLDSMGIDYEEPSISQDKGGYDLFYDGKKAQVKASKRMSLKGNVLKLVGSNPALYQDKLEKVDVLVVVILEERLLFIYDTKTISTNNKNKTITGKPISIKKIPKSLLEN